MLGSRKKTTRSGSCTAGSRTSQIWYTEGTDGEEITRIISARKAEKNDVRRYQEEEME
jgi:uncharacterized DUF497 family protein